MAAGLASMNNHFHCNVDGNVMFVNPVSVHGAIFNITCQDDEFYLTFE